jgi:hypothetical protein
VKVDQKLTPKYWVIHNKTTDDVMLQTASKSLADAWANAEAEFGESVCEDENIEPILIEINFVDDPILNERIINKVNQQS